MNQDYVALLIETVDTVYANWLDAQGKCMALMEELHIAKFDLSRAVDTAYNDGEVVGKNEREREVSLRIILPKFYERVEDLTRRWMIAERTLKSAEIEAEHVKLEVMIKGGGANVFIVNTQKS